ncbi:MAG TPA: FAD-binding protein [Gammaproteobacteria bacterium]|nr:FAD-binding protein [Gammaproteobacteria bacterium]HIL96878.1 FAD-binding protein [Pseudomonadales bacterium]
MTEFLEQLNQVCQHIVSDKDRLRVYESDGLTLKKALPRFVALPETIEEVQATVKLCYEQNVPIVARGAGTGLSGGAMPHEQGVLLSLARLNRILEIDSKNLLARVEPGVTNLAISESVKSLGLYYAPDPSSQIACTIGGNVAENSGGVHCLKYGLTVHNVRKLKIVAPDGELYDVGSSGFDSPGFDLLALMHGSEGMLGIVVEVTVKLLPNPDNVVVVLAGFDSVEEAGASVRHIIMGGLLPAGLEMMDRLAIRAAEDFVKGGYPTDVEALLLCELDGNQHEVDEQLRLLEDILSADNARHVSVARDESARARLWQGRKSAFPAVGRIAPDYYCMDGTIPKRELGNMLRQISELSNEFGLAVANVFHAGDGNLHPLILFDANKSGELQRAEAFGARILELCIEKGGTITGEHGVGVEKIDQMCLQFSTQELELFHGIKAVFDFKGILNPGKAIPTLRRCAEFGAMHVHRGQEKFPGLERF